VASDTARFNRDDPDRVAALGLDLRPAGEATCVRDHIAETNDRMLVATEAELAGLRVALDAMEAAPADADVIEVLIDLVADADEQCLPGLEAALESVLHFDATPAWELVERVREVVS
jgi:hypothetical protein